MPKLAEHHLRIQARDIEFDSRPDSPTHVDEIRSWLSALLGAEHLSLLIGSGLTIGVADGAGVHALNMDPIEFKSDGADAVSRHALRSAKAASRGEGNIEDYLRSAMQLLAGLEVQDPQSELAKAWRAELNETLGTFASRALIAEGDIRTVIETGEGPGVRAAQLLVGFLLAFASRASSRERLNIFTTNYDRLLEYGADLGGLRVLDRFVGTVEPVFRASRLELDVHYNPPGIRGEPRYLEGVVRVCKLHGSLDWRYGRGHLRRMPLAFGGEDPTLDKEALERLIVYPNAAKDVETLLFPYAELLRDFSAALCRPNGVLVTFGYGFGDDHINRIIADMLTVYSTHLLVIAYDDPGERIAQFLGAIAPEQYSLMLGSHFGALGSLVDYYLPQRGSDRLLLRQAGRYRALGTNPLSPSDGGPTHGADPFAVET